jgi:RNA polymerase sigma-70 factor (ECF subfamily)
MVRALKVQRLLPAPLAVQSRESMSDLLSLIARERSEAAFGELFQRYAFKLKAYMLRQGADAATAEELAQETLLVVWRKAALYSSEKGSLSTWIFTIARNLRIDRLRKEAAWQELPDNLSETLVSDDQAPDEAVSDRQREVRVRAVLAELSDEQRQVVEMAYTEGLSHSEISERLGLPLGTVKSRMRLAYQKVRTALEDLK